MKRVYSSITGFLLAGCLILILSGTADAQRGRGGFRGGIHIGGGRGIGFGFGGPRLSFGIGGYSPYYGYPGVGFYYSTLPYGYYPFLWGPDQYYYFGGTFYRPYNNGYTVTAPPIGAAVPQIPSNAHPITIDGQQYYELNGVYYKQSVDDKGKTIYIVSGKDGVLNTNGDIQPPAPRAPQVGDVVNQLPEGCRKVTLSGKKYYVSPDDVYYEEHLDRDNNATYKVASVPEAVTPPVKQ